ncbi:molecular chaperone DnaJ [Candidatus Peregrinibacteria bacterium CG_4_10_14_0_2_um_filter_43_11]|nr:MAG: molecular chaperone DnaJ [Candidatus Peregrinibacteria bacterium CG_4_10_14_0_2_um_filter_43_11]
MDYYKALGVEKNASETEIKKAYRKLAQQCHPDKGEGGDEKKFKEVTEAYEILGDKQKRAQYDQFGSVDKGGGGSGFGGFEGFDFGGFQNVNFDFGGNFGDIFDTFFGGGGAKGKQARESRGSDIEIVIQLDFEEAVSGTTKEVNLSRYESCTHCEGKGNEPGSKMVTCNDCQGTGQKVKIQRTPLGQIQTSAVCSTCGGNGKTPEKKCTTCRGEGRILKDGIIKIKIPIGIHDKAVLRLTGKGEAGMQGASHGDLFVHISITPSKTFERIKDDIHTTQHVHVLQAVLGDEIKVKTIYDETILKIPQGTESGKVFRLRGKGVTRVGSSEKGDHYVKIIVDIPEKLSKKERELYGELIKESGLKITPQNKSIFG